MSFSKLSSEEQREFCRICVARRRAHEGLMKLKEIGRHKEVLIVGDRPGPKAPQTDDYHHTPFYHKLYSGGWLNELLVKAGIKEDKLLWINSATWDDEPTDPFVLLRPFKHVIALGGNASKWLKTHGIDHEKVDHPQYHKRFKAAEPYPLIELLKKYSTETQDEVLS